ncbi:MAG TPA: dihydrofolate reductase family protein [Candidatus Acidoferrales bacterium]|jgi:5-amino-6-(5-phosphoribosylamino)uracil reductase|nr:dihydrofolate reductase family protein [Candidatus Acidoferrales bacterium]
MNLRPCYNASEDTFPLPPDIRACYGPFGFPAPAETHRPYITSNFVIGLDGRASFREIAGRTSGSEVSKSREDRWLMDFLRAHHDAQLIGASTLREEKDADGQGSDYAIEDEQLWAYRREVLGFGSQRVMILTGSGNIDVDHRIFRSSRVEPWILTTSAGEGNLRVRLKALGRGQAIKILGIGEGTHADIAAIVELLRREHGIRTLLCEGGPSLYGELLEKELIDEDFRTISMQVLGESGKAGITRPTAYGHVSYTPESAPWFRLISIHYSLPYHAFFRLRYEGPRRFGAIQGDSKRA